jgi:hypothetical protein
MLERTESLPPAVAMRASFREHYARSVTFKEDGALLDQLDVEAEPVLEALFTAFAPGQGVEATAALTHSPVAIAPSLHEAYALLGLLARRAATLGATPSTSLALIDALVAGVGSAGVALPANTRRELAVVAVESYCAARDERVTAQLRRIAAERQVALTLAPHCSAIFLAGRHEASDLQPTLESMARELLREDARSCLLDLSRLEPPEEELARALGHFCASGSTLGVAIFIVGSRDPLREQFERWGVARGACLFVDDFRQARELALAAAGVQVRPLRQWARLLQRRSRMATP